MKTADFKQIDSARKILGLGEKATLEEIKKRYKELSLEYHPDRSRDEKKKESEEMIKKVNHAYEVLMAYCAGYEYSFRKADVEKTFIDEDFRRHMERFYDGWWGNLDI